MELLHSGYVETYSHFLHMSVLWNRIGKKFVLSISGFDVD